MKKSLLVCVLASLGVTSVLTSCGNDENTVIIYSAAEEERASFLKEELSKKFPDINVVFQAYDTGKLVTKLQAEGTNTDCDIFYDLEACNASKLNSENSNLFCDLSSYDFSIYDDSVVSYTSEHKKFAVNGKTCGTIVVNKKILKENNLSIPTTYNDLLDEKYKNLIVMPNPASSGTGYAFYNGLVSTLGETASINYFNSLDSNIKEYTTSGSAPIKQVDKGEAAVGVCLLWQGVTYSNNNSDLEVVFLNNEASYSLFTMGIISGKESNTSVKSVFDYLYNDLNKRQVTKFNPDKIYKNQGKAEIDNYPTSFTEINMIGSFDFNHKKDLLDKWKH